MTAARFDPSASFRELLAEAIREISETGYVSPERVNEWLMLLRNAAERELGPDKDVDEEIRRSLGATFERFVNGSKLTARVEGVSRFTREMVKPKLHAELDRRILAAADLIKINKREAVETTLRRFAGWATSIPPGGDETIERRETRSRIGEELRDYKYRVRLVANDQSHKLISNIAALVAEDGGAIAARWNSHGAYDTSYNARKEHLERDGRTYLIRGSWAHREGLVKPVYGYTDQIDACGQLPNCRCWMTYVTSPRRLPDAFLTRKGQDWIARGRESAHRMAS